jgi:hypothetical protein
MLNWRYLFLMTCLSWGLAVGVIPDDVLKRSVSVPARTTIPLNEVSSLLREANVWGGIENYRLRCEPEVEISTPEFHGTLDEGLKLVREQVGSLEWEAKDGGINLTVNSPHVSSVLDTRIEEFTFDEYDAVSLTTGSLLASPQVMKRINEEGLSIRSPELGFAQLRAGSSRMIILRNVTVRDALNSIARLAFRRVWLYQEVRCGTNNTLKVDWPIR